MEGSSGSMGPGTSGVPVPAESQKPSRGPGHVEKWLSRCGQTHVRHTEARQPAVTCIAMWGAVLSPSRALLGTSSQLLPCVHLMQVSSNRQLTWLRPLLV